MALAYGTKELVSLVIKEITTLLVKEAFNATSSLMSSDETIFIEVQRRITKIKDELEHLVHFLNINGNESQKGIWKPWWEKVSAIAMDAKSVIDEIENVIERNNSFSASLLDSVNKRASTQMWKKMDDRLKVIESQIEHAFKMRDRYRIQTELSRGQSSSHCTYFQEVQVPMLTGVHHETDTNSNPQSFASNLDALDAVEFGPQRRQRIAQLRDAGLSKKARSALLGSFVTSTWRGQLEHQIPEDIEVKLFLNNIKGVMDFMRRVGLKSSNLIIGIDFTNSNESAGEFSFYGQNLHTIGGVKNPYEQVLSIVGEALSPVYQDNLIHCFGFGNGSTRDQNVFSFYPDVRPCKDIEEVLERYRELVQDARLAGPTSFAPIIEMAMTSVVHSTECSYSILLIITDGQVTRRSSTSIDELSQQEKNTVDAIFRASQCPLSIIMVGVGDGPWDLVCQLENKIPSRPFNNFKFVNFTEIMSKQFPLERRSKEFAQIVLWAVTAQYKSMLNLGMLRQKLPEMDVPARVPLPPPPQEKIRRAMAVDGLEYSNLIIGIDFTMSNEWAGLRSFNHQSLHALGEAPNPYEQVISIVGQELSRFCKDNNIHCFGFGDRSTCDHDTFSFYADERPCNGIENVLERYREIVPHVRLSGPKCFGPIIEMSMSSIVRCRCSRYPNTVLLIITNRQFTWGNNTRECEPSQQERNTIDAIVRASRYPLSIIMVGVGDGPWDTINQFKDKIPSCPFDNFKFVNFTEIMSKETPIETKLNEFAQMVVTGVTAPYNAMLNLGIFRREPPEIDMPERVALPPPHREKILLRSSSRDVCSNRISLFVSDAMAELGLEHVNLMLGIDFSKSNERAGHQSFDGRNLHAIGDTPNPYEQVLSIVGEALSPLYDLIHCFGFGDESTLDKDVFSFNPMERPCNGMMDVLQRYRELVPHVILSEKSPTSFVPLIEMSTSRMIHDLNGSYSILLIITDGQATRNVKKRHGQLSSQEERAIDAIVRASHYPLSIIMVGVGDGPWDKMHQFMEKIPSRPFYNFQFVNFTEIMSDGVFSENEEEFALKVVLGAIAELKAVNGQGNVWKMKEETDGLRRVPLPPPVPSVNRQRT